MTDHTIEERVVPSEPSETITKNTIVRNDLLVHDDRVLFPTSQLKLKNSAITKKHRERVKIKELHPARPCLSEI